MIFVFVGKDGNIARKAGLSASSKFVHYTFNIDYYVFDWHDDRDTQVSCGVACGSDEGWGW
jgi:hypothetical protein